MYEFSSVWSCRVCSCARVPVRACVRACVCACVRACVCVFARARAHVNAHRIVSTDKILCLINTLIVIILSWAAREVLPVG